MNKGPRMESNPRAVSFARSLQPTGLPQTTLLLRRAAGIAAVVFLVVILVNQGFDRGPAFYRIIRDSYTSQDTVLGGSDFTAFFGGTRLLLHSPSRAYDPHAQARAILEAKGRDQEGEDGA